MKDKQKPIIEITYYGVCADEPTVKVPEGLDVEIKLIDAFEQDTLVLEWGGIKVFSGLREEYRGSYEASEYWVSTHPAEDYDGGDCFDIRDLPKIPAEDAPAYAELADELRRIAYAIDQGWITEDGYDDTEEEETA